MEPWNTTTNYSVPRSLAAWPLKQLKKVLGSGEDPNAMWPASLVGVHFRQLLTDAYVRQICGDRVRSGPFEGMVYPLAGSGSLPSPKLLGSYEAELHPVFEDISRYRRFVDIGCDEGYYVVGAALRHPDLEVLGFDLNPDAQENCRRLASANDVGDRIEVAGLCTPERLADLAVADTLVLIDIEGAEVELLREAGGDALRAADLVIEAHKVKNVSTTDTVIGLLQETHEITVLPQTVRDPSAFPELLALSQLQRFLSQWEGRGSDPWIFARAR
ncbi:MAG: hypothetical protein RIB31_13995 [Thalassobaculaceae bacterium]